MKPEKQKKHAALRALLIALLTLALLAAGFAAYRFWRLPRAGFAVHFVDIGQGDAAIVVCDGKTLVIDGGMPESGAKLVDYLQNTLHVSTIDAMIGTHPHADHIGGLPDVIRAFAVKTLYSPVDEFEGKPFEAMKRAADAKNVRITVPQAGQRFSLGRAEVEFYAPLGIYDDVNDLSLVTRITYGQTAFLFTGDAERPSENDMIDSDEALSATVLKVGHHGSNTSSSYLFLRQVMPSYAVISCGRDNAYGHPHQEVLARLRDIGAAVYRTDESGTIVCRSNGERVAFETEKGKKPTATPGKGQSVGYVGNIKSKKFSFKLRKRHIAAAALVLMLSAAVYMNYLYSTGGLNPLLEAGKNYGDSILVGKKSEENTEETAGTAASYFSEARVSRQQSRDEAVQTIQNLYGSGESDDVHTASLIQKAEEITANMELETKIESIIKAKGFDDCIVYISGDYADVMVQTDGLLQTEAALIKEAIIQETAVPVENISIVEVKE